MDSNPKICEEKLTTSNLTAKFFFLYDFSCHKQPTFLVVQLFQIFIYFYTFYTSIVNLTSLIKPLTVLMMVQQNRNAIVSTDFVSL